MHSKPQRSEEPSVLSTQVSLLQSLLHVLLRLLPLADLLECIVGDDTLQSFQFECVSRRHDVVVVDELDEWLDLRPLLYSLLAHAAGDFGWVALNAGD